MKRLEERLDTDVTFLCVCVYFGFIMRMQTDGQSECSLNSASSFRFGAVNTSMLPLLKLTPGTAGTLLGASF